MPTRVTLLKRWRGRVEDVDAQNGVFRASITDLMQPFDARTGVEFQIEDASPAEQDLIKPGASFYWTHAFKDSPGGQRTRVSTIRFSKLTRDIPPEKS